MGFRRVVRLGVGVAVATVAVLTCAIVGPNVWVWGASQGRLHDVASVPQRSVGIVLGAGLEPGRKPTPFLAARLDAGQQLLEAGKVDVLLLSGDNGHTSHNEPVAMQQYLLERGVPAESMVLDYAGFDTHDTCRRAAAIFGVRDATMVSQAFHVPRAVALCRAAGIDAVGVGDVSVAGFAPRAWWTGRLREGPAAVKAAADVITDRQPVLGAPEMGVADALQRAGSASRLNPS